MSKLPANISVNFLGKSLKPAVSTKDLGVTLDSHLTYDNHISQLVSSCMNKLCQINRAKNSFDTKTLSEIIKSLVVSKMLYCSTMWSNTSASNVKKVQSIQNFACKIVTKCHQSTTAVLVNVTLYRYHSIKLQLANDLLPIELSISGTT